MGPGAERRPGAWRRLDVTAPPLRPRARARAASLALRDSASGTGGRHLGPRDKMATRNGVGAYREGKRMMRVYGVGGGPRSETVVAKSRGPEEETF